MKLKAGEVFAAVETIQKLASVKLPIKGKYGISRIAAKLAPEHQVIAKERDELIIKHGVEKNGRPEVSTHIEVDIGGKKDMVPNPAYIEFIKDFSAVLSQEIEVDCPRVKLADLGDGETDVDLAALLPFIDDDAAAKTPPDLKIVKDAG